MAPQFYPMSYIEIILGTTAFIAVTYLGLMVFLKNPQSWTNRFFALLALTLELYVIANPISLHPPQQTPENQLFWIQVIMFLASFMGPLLFLLVHTFPENKILLKKRYLFVVLSVMSVTAIASLNFLVFKSISYPNGQALPDPGSLMPLFLFDFAGFILLSIVVVIKKYLKAAGEHKLKLFYFLSGLGFTFSLMALSTVLSIMIFKSSAGIFLGPISPVILAGFIAYAIVKHRFLDIHPIIARTVSFVIFIILFALIYAVIILFGIERILGINIQGSLFLVFLGLTVAAISTSGFLERAIRRITNRLFFQGQYDSNLLLTELTKLMAETIDLDYMTKAILEKITNKINISKAAFLIVDDHKITSIKAVGNIDHENIIPELVGLFHRNVKIANCCTLEELEDGNLKDTFRKLDISAAIPIKVEDKEVAILVLGIKRSGEIYYQRDMNFLNTFASEAGIAIQNAKSYQRVKEFSKELEKKVEERTTELKITQERELAKAKEVAKLKDEFVFIAAHELRTPVTAIRGFLELTDITNTSFPKDIKHNLNAISNASNHLNQLITDLLEIARSDAGITAINTQPHEFEPILADVLKEISPLIEKKELTLNVDVKKTGLILCDPAKLKELLMNLLSNAIKYNRDRGAININAYQSPEGGYLMVEVEDTGYGIPQDQQSQIFQKFFRAPVKETQEVIGTGLGLFIVRMLVEKMGGKISFSSTEQKGTTFTFTLPLTNQ